ncbi:SH3 domain-containing protein [Neolewinella antarctica]|uniref:SH3b domain-containing protein n=1 Tax=Neolewinella antarctica TaxID=442734 RepID=A0ABX0XF57_9BACT|nr:SH3 domain-containing protein [Neolewinella antarctica]NJC27954.1 hypothetical protein [Neolewinella antarctica]
MLRYLLITLLFTTTLSAQNINPDRNTVVATKGLLLRAQPSANGTIVTGIPFGETVDVFDPCDYGYLTAGNLRDYHRFDHGNGRLEYHDQTISGQWLRVRYGRDTGYVFDAYLAERFTTPTLLDDDANEIEPSLVMLEPGQDISASVYRPGDYHFYGVYETSPGRMALREVEINYFVASDELRDALFVSAKPARDLSFVVGSKTPLKPHTFSGRNFNAYSLIYTSYEGPERAKFGPSPGITVGEPGVDTFAEGPEIFVATPGGPVALRPDNSFAEEVFYAGAGDVDGDGVQDYRLIYSSERSWRPVLFLSSFGWKGVSFLTASGGCC